MACYIERERKRKQIICWESRLTSKRIGFFGFGVHLFGHLSFEPTLIATRKREKEKESERVSIYWCHRQFDFLDNSKFALWKLCLLLQYHTRYFSFADLLFLDYDYPHNNIIEMDQNTEKSPGDFRRLAVI